MSCSVKDHKAMTPVRLEPATPRSRVKHITAGLPKKVYIYNSACNVSFWDLAKNNIVIWFFEVVCQGYYFFVLS